MAKDYGFDANRLVQAMRGARRQLRIFRENRREAVRQYVGKNWSEDGTKERVLVNMIGLYASIVCRNLVARSPRVMLSTFDRAMKPTVSAMQDWMNKKLDGIGFGGAMQRIALDALFSVGIGKVALTSPGEANLGGYNRSAGEPFFCAVDLDDAVWDMHARCLEEVSFVGHRYRVPLEVVQDSKLYSKERKKLTADSDNPYNLDGDEKVGAMARGGDTDEDEFEEYVELWEIYLPRQKAVVTLAEGADEPLRSQTWLGPACGPYHFLAMGDVPGNSFPKAPVMDLVDLHLVVNHLYRKLARQAERQKTVLGVAGGADEDGSRIIRAEDGEAIKVDNPDRAKEYRFGGVDQQGLGFAIHAKDVFAYLGGNLDALGGLSPQAQTLGQDQMLEKNASKLVADLQDRTVKYAELAMKALGWYWWNDPFKTMESKFSLASMPSAQLIRRVTPADRQQGKFEDLQIDIDPYSMQHQTPQTKLAALNQVVTQIVLPAMPLMQQQGMTFDLSAYLKKVAAYSNMPDLEDIVSMHAMPDTQAGPDQGGGGEEAGEGGQGKPDYVSTAPATTNRSYTRVSTSAGSTPQSRSAASAQQLMGGGGSPAGGNGAVRGPA